MPRFDPTPATDRLRTAALLVERIDERTVVVEMAVDYDVLRDVEADLDAMTTLGFIDLVGEPQGDSGVDSCRFRFVSSAGADAFYSGVSRWTTRRTS